MHAKVLGKSLHVKIRETGKQAVHLVIIINMLLLEKIGYMDIRVQILPPYAPALVPYVIIFALGWGSI